MEMKRILLTGAAGTIGTSMRNYLGSKYHIRCLDINPIEDEEDVVTVDITDFESLLNAMQGVDAVIHLANNPNSDQRWQDVYSSGITGTYNVFEAARRAGVKKVIYASSTFVLGWKEMQQGKKVTPMMPIYPRTLYGIGKAVGELLAHYFVDTYQMSIICLRIGTFSVKPPYPQSLQDDILRSWCSAEDLAQLINLSLETDGLGFQVFYGVSNNRRRLWSITNSQKLVGYRPQSNAENLIKDSREAKEKYYFSRDHILLMRAAIQDDLRAFEAWQQWLKVVNFEKDALDSIQYRLLPFVYNNLADQRLDHPLMPKLKGIYRRDWLENQLAFQQIIPFLAKMQDRHIPVLLLDDFNSILCLYEGQGLRRPYSLEILIRPDDILKFLDLCKELKIWPKVSNPIQVFSIETPLEIWPPFDLPLSITWRVFPMIKTHEEALAVWQVENSALLGEYPVFTLDLESHFLRSCLRAIGVKSEEAFFALIDVAWMLRKQAVEIDWDRVVELTRRNHLALPVINILEEINAFVEMSKGKEILQQLHKLPISWMDRLEQRVIYLNHPFPNLFIQLGRRLFLYRRSPKIPGVLGFFRYLQIVWGGNSLLSLPRLVARHFGIDFPFSRKK